jgi:ornithine decarboxylase antizyme 1
LVQGLCGIPDEPHAANVSLVTEGSGVGVSTEPFVAAKNKNVYNNLAQKTQIASNLCFEVTVNDCKEVSWNTLYHNSRLYVEIPDGILPDGSKESFVTLLEYAEEQLHCSQVIVYFKKDRADRACLIRTFMFLGFTLVMPGTNNMPQSADLLWMAYEVE